MRIVDLIIRKRDGRRLSRDEIDAFISGVTAGEVPDYQASALLMAIFLRGLDAEETGWLTDAMVRSGGRVDLSGLSGVKVGKHSTGGVGDKTSLVVVPVVAACGALVPKSSGRALGHSGGTLDKLEAIPGFRLGLTADELIAQVRAIGCAFVGQSPTLAPADKKLYALRDVTGTVESLPLIASSIMSKKIAEGTDALVLDVKVGSGAFMKTLDDARRLAQAMVDIGARVGLRTRAVLTAMDAPLGLAVGNALELREALETLKGRGPSDLTLLCRTLAAHLLVVGALAQDFDAAGDRVDETIRSGVAFERFRSLVEHQGGDVRVVDDWDRLPRAERVETVSAPGSGFVTQIRAEPIGRASMLLGAGRTRVDASIDYGAGIVLRVKPGDRVGAGAALADVHVGRSAQLDVARSLLDDAFVISDRPPVASPLILDVVA
jgi:pyrimidine-nucleoside phosphorylase